MKTDLVIQSMPTAYREITSSLGNDLNINISSTITTLRGITSTVIRLLTIKAL